ncbi:MAG TPA: fibronectin type III domain-containing protein [candidate division Zixibacteria bacterium]|nr:fibronectin type III domain-containing protein [candidate division Zixibacteria bacterium]
MYTSRGIFTNHLVFVTVVLILTAITVSQARVPVTNIDQNTEQPALLSQTTTGGDCNFSQFGVHVTAEARSSFNCNGTFGSTYGLNDKANWSFETPYLSGNDYLFGGAIWIGGIVNGDTLVSVSADGWSSGREMYPDGGYYDASVRAVDYFSGTTYHSHFSDTVISAVETCACCPPYVPLNLDLSLRSYSYDITEYSGIVIYDLIITNVGQSEIEQGYSGFHIDVDAGSWSDDIQPSADDVSGSLPALGIGYAMDNDGDFAYSPATDRALASMIIKSSTAYERVNFNWWLSNITASYDFGPRLKGTVDDPYRDFGTGGTGTPVGDSNKYYILSHEEWDYDQVFTGTIEPDDSIWMYPLEDIAVDFADGFDTRYLLSAGPFDLSPGESERVVLAMFSGGAVHVDTTNGDNLYVNPELYLAGLNLSGLESTALAARDLVDTVLNPLLPVMGTRIIENNTDEVIVQWDPWVFPEVTGYAVYLREIESSSLTHPGVLEPWLTIAIDDLYTTVAAGPRSYTFTDLDQNNVYAVAVANISDEGVGLPGAPVVFRPGGNQPGPAVDQRYAFSIEGSSVELTFADTTGMTVDHYNIYRYTDSMAAINCFTPFYDTGCALESLTPVDVVIDPATGIEYYYYAQTPYSTAFDNSFEDNASVDDSWYSVTAVDIYGFESSHSSLIPCDVIEERNRDILLITDNVSTQSMVSPDTIISFYDGVLAGWDYDIYHYLDSTSTIACPDDNPECFDWHDFMPYRTIILDDDIRDRILDDEWETSQEGFARYLLSGGRLIYCGATTATLGLYMSSEPDTVLLTDIFPVRLFDVDSLYFVPFGYCLLTVNPPCSDEVSGFASADPTDPDWPTLTYDTSRYPYTSNLEILWATTSPPNLVGLWPSESAEVLYTASTLYPAISPLEDMPVGVKSVVGPGESFWFGFHLWYMRPAEVRNLIEKITGLSCCWTRGDVNHSGGNPDIVDIVHLALWLFQGGIEPICPESADVNGSGGLADLSDLVYLVAYAFQGGPPPIPCD